MMSDFMSVLNFLLIVENMYISADGSMDCLMRNQTYSDFIVILPSLHIKAFSYLNFDLLSYYES